MVRIISEEVQNKCSNKFVILSHKTTIVHWISKERELKKGLFIRRSHHFTNPVFNYLFLMELILYLATTQEAAKWPF